MHSVKINQEELEHLELEERKTMKIFTRRAKQLGTVNAI
jgi:hypothetical protein